MGNRITSRAQPGVELDLGNGLTSALLDVLVLAGSELAETAWEREVVVWLAGHDQAILGGGTVGFDVSEAGWSAADFAGQQRFLLAVIDAAAARRGWERLDYTPGEPVPPALAALRELVAGLDAAAVDGIPRGPALEAAPDGARCPRHQTLRHEAGCLLCNAAGATVDG